MAVSKWVSVASGMLIALAAAAVAMAGPANARGPATDAPSNLSDWGLHCWCLTARRTPQAIISADDNGRILAMAAEGVTRADLDRRLPGIRDSQLALLQAYGLLKRDGERYTTTFPIFGPDLIVPIRRDLAILARRTASEVRRDVATIVASARAQRHPSSAYAMVFGYALDGTLWDELRRRGLLPDTTLDLDHPYWRGGFWAIYPERPEAAGRNDVRVGRRTLVGVWTDATVASLNRRLEEVEGRGASADLTGLPVVTDREGDPVHDAGHRIARAAVAQLVDSQEGRALRARLPREQREQALLAIAHEFIWSVLERLVADGAVRKPAVLSSTEAGRSGDVDVRELLFVIDGGPAR